MHESRKYRNKKECGIENCNFKHHYLLHKPATFAKVKDSSFIVAIHNISSSSILYRIIPITIYTNKKSITEYALLDEASGPTIIDKSVLDKLDLHVENPTL